METRTVNGARRISMRSEQSKSDFGRTMRSALGMSGKMALQRAEKLPCSSFCIIRCGGSYTDVVGLPSDTSTEVVEVEEGELDGVEDGEAEGAGCWDEGKEGKKRGEVGERVLRDLEVLEGKE